MAIVTINLVVIIVVVSILEIVASFFVVRPLGYSVPHPVLNHTWKPNSSFVIREWIADNPDFPDPYTHTFNAQGWLEEYDVSREKGPGDFRIFYIGDSFTQGTAPMDLSMPSLVEAELNRLGEAAGQRFEVINTGTLSYSPTIYYVLLRYFLMSYDPDLVVINVDMTDSHDDWKYAQTVLVDEGRNPVAIPSRDIWTSPYIDTEAGAVRSSLRRRIELFLYTYSHTYHVVRTLARRGRDPDPGVRPAATGAEIDEDVLVGWFDWAEESEWSAQTECNVARTLNMLRRIDAFARESGLRVMWTGVPHYHQYAGSPDGSGAPAWTSRPHYVLQDLATELSVPYLNAYEALLPSVAGTPWTRYYYAGDMHFNPRGYRIWADAQLAFLLDPANGLLPDAMYGERAEATSGLD